MTSTCFVRFDRELCAGHGSCLRFCPTKAIRIKNKKAARIVEQCIGCGECIRICRERAVSAASEGPKILNDEQVAIALVSPVLYAQFPGVMPKDILLGLRQMGFQHTMAGKSFYITSTRARPKWIPPVCRPATNLHPLKSP